MIYRLVTVWHDEENDPPIVRSACDFDTPEIAGGHIIEAVRMGVIRVETTRAQMPGGGCLSTIYIPIGRIVGWYLYELPDTTPPVTGKLL